MQPGVASNGVRGEIWGRREKGFAPLPAGSEALELPTD